MTDDQWIADALADAARLHDDPALAPAWVVARLDETLASLTAEAVAPVIAPVIELRPKRWRQVALSIGAAAAVATVAFSVTSVGSPFGDRSTVDATGANQESNVGAPQADVMSAPAVEPPSANMLPETSGKTAYDAGASTAGVKDARDQAMLADILDSIASSDRVWRLPARTHELDRNVELLFGARAASKNGAALHPQAGMTYSNHSHLQVFRLAGPHVTCRTVPDSLLVPVTWRGDDAVVAVHRVFSNVAVVMVLDCNEPTPVFTRAIVLNRAVAPAVP